MCSCMNQIIASLFLLKMRSLDYMISSTLWSFYTNVLFACKYADHKLPSVQPQANCDSRSQVLICNPHALPFWDWILICSLVSDMLHGTFCLPLLASNSKSSYLRLQNTRIIGILIPCSCFIDPQIFAWSSASIGEVKSNPRMEGLSHKNVFIG